MLVAFGPQPIRSVRLRMEPLALSWTWRQKMHLLLVIVQHRFGQGRFALRELRAARSNRRVFRVSPGPAIGDEHLDTATQVDECRPEQRACLIWGDRGQVALVRGRAIRSTRAQGNPVPLPSAGRNRTIRSRDRLLHREYHDGKNREEDWRGAAGIKLQRSARSPFDAAEPGIHARKGAGRCKKPARLPNHHRA